MEVDHLRQEVERLAGEVVVLRGVVEEGLKERREIKEQHSARSSHMDDASEVLDDNQNSNDSRSDVSAGDMSTIHAAQSKYAAHTSLLSPPSSRPASRSSHRGALPSSIEHSLAHDAGEEEEPFISSAEMDRISQELSERRTERSISAYSGKSPSASREMQSQVRRDPPAKTSSRRPFEVPPRESKLDPVNVQAATRGSSGHRNAADPRLQRQPSAGSSSAPGLQKQKLQQYDDGHEYKMDPLLSRIPAARLDCPSGPSHEPQTCTICHRRRLRQRKPAADGEEEPWIRELDARIGKISSQGTAPQGPTKTIGNIPQRTRDPADDKLPPQTVLTKVLRELEDDFVHYKAYVL